MPTVAVAGGSRKEILELVRLSKSTLSEEVKFIVFDTEANLASRDVWDYRACSSLEEMVRKTVACAASGEADILLKGGIQTHSLLKEVLRAEHNLKQKKLLSHVALISLPSFQRPILLTDAGMNISPSTEQMSAIIDNVLDVTQAMGMSRPKLAILSAAENINPKMPSSITAQKLTDQFRSDRRAIIYGPLSLDLALSKDSAELKRFEGPVRGDADVLVVPGIDAGNVLYKSLLLFGEAKIGGTIVGTRVPIVLTSRSDTVENKRYALDFALMQLSSQTEHTFAGEDR
ncbi:Phosphate butyryltransferase [Alkalibacterium sp. AK22]|uniref:phosphate acyltransferase n=1 Tax=Alkalibacterium sp. AK22 TaxID=1229520 RepID=UPI0004451391|nr:phosphate acyltransferase [Alkalibacterium sp. AK22]EXJ23237.1 Phosphate butyryltransferase [Alkalibacterium sp. AK22]